MSIVNVIPRGIFVALSIGVPFIVWVILGFTMRWEDWPERIVLERSRMGRNIIAVRRDRWLKAAFLGFFILISLSILEP